MVDTRTEDDAELHAKEKVSLDRAGKELAASTRFTTLEPESAGIFTVVAVRAAEPRDTPPLAVQVAAQPIAPTVDTEPVSTRLLLVTKELTGD